ncbi:MAG: YqgE/AlgH family protein [Deltaproteobacteria bacterium]|nr:YqgE/AlgH family protein [Deltaproteobacteria bacterium]
MKFFELISVAAVGLILSSTGKPPIDLGSSPKRDQSGYLAGQLLVATGEISDRRFAQTVIYMVMHNKAGAMGLVVNRPVAKGPMADLLKSLGAENKDAKGEIVIHYGGPVEPETGFVLHSDDYVVNGTIRVRDGIAATSSVEVLRAISQGKGPRESLFAFGYAGWGPGQLEAEISRNAWFSIPAEKELIFGADAESKWQRATDRRKVPL